MSQVRFYAMKLDFQFFKDNYDPQNTRKFILQYYMADAEKWRDELTLLIYVLDSQNNVLVKRDLSIDKKYFYRAKERVEFANIHMSNALIAAFIQEDQKPGGKIDYLYFKPYDFGDYTAYRVTAHKEGLRILVEGDLRPSPPARPDYEP